MNTYTDLRRGIYTNPADIYYAKHDAQWLPLVRAVYPHATPEQLQRQVRSMYAPYGRS